MLAENSRQLFNSSALKECCQGQIFPELLLNLSHQADGEKGMTAEVKEVVPYSNGVDIQKLFPNLRQLPFQRFTGWDKACF